MKFVAIISYSIKTLHEINAEDRFNAMMQLDSEIDRIKKIIESESNSIVTDIHASINEDKMAEFIRSSFSSNT